MLQQSQTLVFMGFIVARLPSSVYMCGGVVGWLVGWLVVPARLGVCLLVSARGLGGGVRSVL